MVAHPLGGVRSQVRFSAASILKALEMVSDLLLPCLVHIIIRQEPTSKNASHNSDNNHFMDSLEDRMQDWQPC